MRHDFTFERRAITLAVVLLVGADVALAAYSWKLAASPRPQQDLAVLTRNRDLLRADITRAQDIRHKMPDIQKDCDQFEKSLFPANAGASSVTAELGSIAGKSGLLLESSTFRQNELKSRGLTEVEIEAVVTGSYSGVVHFLNGLQRSGQVYAVQGLTAKSDVGQQGARGGVRVTMHIKTYFRTV